MKSLAVIQARAQLSRLLNRAPELREPIQIAGTRSSAILVAEEDWRGIQETLYLLSTPGLGESIRAGLAEPLSATSSEPGW
jgi:PHD/YefM family antitoxin component YafN of YafNO toxin-antitoxin module